MPVEATAHASLLADLAKTPKEIPFSYLYDEKGSDLYEDITALEEYYPYKEEERLLKQNVDDILRQIPENSVVVELGCGTARKTAQLLNALVARDGSCRFAGIDVSGSFLEEARMNLMRQVPGLRSAQITMVEAHYIPGLHRVRAKYADEMLCLIWLGSSVGNLSSEEAVTFLRQVGEATGPKMQLLLCTDLWKDPSVLYAAYHDQQGVTEAFIKNGVRAAFRSLGKEVSDEEEASWEYEVEVSQELRRVEMWVRIPRGLHVDHPPVLLAPGERLLMEVSRKFRAADVRKMAEAGGFCVSSAWRSKKYGIQMVVPFEERLRQCWADTEAFFASLPDWTAKPLDMRHPFCFYYGHVAAFAKLKVLPSLPASEMEVQYSRGIDPSLLHPDRCHHHPAPPPTWHTRPQLQAFVSTCRSAILGAVRSAGVGGRMVSMVVEHEGMHAETLEYMRLQDRKAEFDKAPPTHLPPPSPRGLPPCPPLETPISIPAGCVVLGVDFKEEGFVWDNEGPRGHPIRVPAFTCAPNPVSVAQFREFAIEQRGYEKAEWWQAEDLAFFQKRKQTLPATWSMVEGEVYVHDPQGGGGNHWSRVADTAALVSLSEAMAYCAWKGGRVMSEEEYARLLEAEEGERVHSLRDGGWEWTSSVFGPLEGFVAMAEYPEYSADFFDGQHYTLKGASQVTPKGLRRDSFRNFYQRQYPFVFAKFRCCGGPI